MTKPHEEKWELAGVEVVPNGDRDVCGKFYGPCAVAEGRARLAHAAPDMARALLRALTALESSSHPEECPVMDDDDEDEGDPAKACICMKGACEADFRAALRKAGVIP